MSMSMFIADIAAEQINWSEIAPVAIAAAIIVLLLQSIINDNLKK